MACGRYVDAGNCAGLIPGSNSQGTASPRVSGWSSASAPPGTIGGAALVGSSIRRSRPGAPVFPAVTARSIAGSAGKTGGTAAPVALSAAAIWGRPSRNSVHNTFWRIAQESFEVDLVQILAD